MEESLDFLDSVSSALRSLCGGDAGRGILVGYSGGADSTALAAALASLDPGPLSLCYVDHGMRSPEELLAERSLVRRNADALGLPLKVVELGRGAVEERAAREGSGPEAAARELRLAALEAVRSAQGLAWIALGHNAQDQAETRIARFFQGSGPRGLRGIPPRRGRIVRPLLSLWREDILSFLSARGLPWSEESSNAEGPYLRNRIRRELLPAIQSVFPGWRRALDSGGGRSGLIADLLEGSVRGILAEDGEGLCAEYAAFEALHPASRLQLLEDASSRLRPGTRTSGAFLLRAIQPIPADGVAASGAGLEVSRRGDLLLIRKRLVQSHKKGYFFPVAGPGEWTFPGGLRLSIPELPEGQGEGLRFPALLRTMRMGDRMEVPGGGKALSDILGEWGVPADKKDSIPVLEDAEGIAAVFGRLLGYRNRFAERLARRGGGQPELSIEGSTASDV